MISNKKLGDRVKKLPTDTIDNYKVNYDIWEIKRLFDIESSKNKKETFKNVLQNNKYQER